jgi:hypothetical protein
MCTVLPTGSHKEVNLVQLPVHYFKEVGFFTGRHLSARFFLHAMVLPYNGVSIGLPDSYFVMRARFNSIVKNQALSLEKEYA